VYGVPNDEGSHDIAAAVILRTNASVTAADLKRFLSQIIPPYAVPVHITIMTDFPRTGSGKIDRRALQAQADEQLS
jgi:acyl-coenzyme A synthetase/AMP-(fatty) acid ligase